MSTGRKTEVGIGFESTWGTPVVPSYFIPTLESLEVEKPMIESAGAWGHYDTPPMVEGRQRVAGALSEFEARPTLTGALLLLLTGDYAVTGAGPYTHVYDFYTSPFASTTALRPATVYTERPDGTRTYHEGGQLNGLTLNADIDSPLRFSGVDFLFEDYSDGVADATPTYETAVPFSFRHAAHEVNASAFNLWESFQIQFNNNIQAEYLQQTGEGMAATFLGKRDIRITGTVAYRDSTLWPLFIANSTEDFKFKWTISASLDLEINIPAGRLKVGRAVTSLDRITRSVEIVAEYDATATHAAQLTLINSVADYTA